MALIRAERDEEYFPDYGLLVVRETWTEGDDEGFDGSHFDDPDYDGPVGEFDAEPGTLVCAGAGWLQACAGSRAQTVTLELHDAEPPADDDAWDDVAETPFLTRTGRVLLDHLIPGVEDDGFVLAGPGLYRVRVARRPVGEAREWSLRFWRVGEPARPPRHLKRTDLAVWPEPDGWDELIGFPDQDLIWWVADAVRENGSTTLAEVDGWGLRHHRPEGWLDRPLSPVERFGDGALTYAGMARQLNVPAPRTLRDLLPLYFAAGVLTGDPAGVFTLAAPVPRVRDVFRLSAAERSRLARAADQRFDPLAGDLLFQAVWSPGLRVPKRVLREWLLVDDADLDAALAHASGLGLAVDAHADGSVTLTRMGREPGPDQGRPPTM